MTTERIDVAIVGGGLVGCAAAFFLARRGVPVALLEAGRCGAQASGVNFGGVRLQGRQLCEIPLALRARKIWRDLPALVGEDCEYRTTGHLRLARNAADLDDLSRYAASLAPFGVPLDIVDGPELRRRWPAFSGRIAGASWSPDDGQANPRLVAPAFARAARGAGARIVEGACVTAVEPLDGSGFAIRMTDGSCVASRWLVNAAGAWGRALAASLGDAIPVTAIYPNMVVTEPLSYFLEPSLGVYGGGIYLRQVERGNVVFGGGRGRPIGRPAGARIETVATDRARPSAAAGIETGRLAAELLPRLARAQVVRTWTGIEADTADGLPAIGASPRHPRLIHAFGLSGHGFQPAPAIGAVLAELIVDGGTDTPIAAFAPGRFDRIAADGREAASLD